MRKMILWSDTRFLAAHRLYRNLGFREIGTRELNDSNNSVEYGFELSL
jgi:putative acetyltransferase